VGQWTERFADLVKVRQRSPPRPKSPPNNFKNYSARTSLAGGGERETSKYRSRDLNESKRDEQSRKRLGRVDQSKEKGKRFSSRKVRSARRCDPKVNTPRPQLSRNVREREVGGKESGLGGLEGEGILPGWFNLCREVEKEFLGGVRPGRSFGIRTQIIALPRQTSDRSLGAKVEFNFPEGELAGIPGGPRSHFSQKCLNVLPGRLFTTRCENRDRTSLGLWAETAQPASLRGGSSFCRREKKSAREEKKRGGGRGPGPGKRTPRAGRNKIVPQIHWT